MAPSFPDFLATIGLKQLTFGAAGFIVFRALFKNVVTRIRLRKFTQLSDRYKFGFRYFLGCHRIPKKLEDLWPIENKRFEDMASGKIKMSNEVSKGILVTWMTPFHYMITLNSPEAVVKLYGSNDLKHQEKNYGRILKI